jgi:hypothetical protein
MEEVKVFSDDGAALFGTVLCPCCQDGGFLVHSETPQWLDTHEDDMFDLRPVSIALDCHSCGEKFALGVRTHKGIVNLSWRKAVKAQSPK